MEEYASLGDYAVNYPATPDPIQPTQSEPAPAPNSELTELDCLNILRQSVHDMWTEHLNTYDYVTHIALEEYYHQMLHIMDGMIECLKSMKAIEIGGPSKVCYMQYQGEPVQYLIAIRIVLQKGRDSYWRQWGEINAYCDDIDKAISTAIYKIKNLKNSVVCPNGTLESFVESYKES